MPSACLLFLSIAGTLLVFAGVAAADDVEVEWDAPTTHADGSPLTGAIQGYNVFLSGTRGGPYSPVASNIPLTTYTLLNLQTGSHFAVVTAVHSNGLESIVSNELPIHINTADSDGDGLSDFEETTIYNTNPNDSDSDDDGMSDGDEVSKWFNPLDPGSYFEALFNYFCSQWNGFYQARMWNIAEHVNFSSSVRQVTTSLFDINGFFQSQLGFSVLTGAQTDILVHDMPGRIANSYGKACSLVNGADGDVGGRMVHYLPGAEMEFAFSMEFSNGLSGSQFLLENTYQPSGDPSDAGDFVANWIQITNEEATFQTGDLIYYAQGGGVNAVDEVELPAGSRRDFSGHQFGPNLVGLIEWRPHNSTARFQARNIRYYFSTPLSSIERFDSALQLDGQRGSGEKLVAPLDARNGSAIFEVGNTLPVPIVVLVRIFTAAGVMVFNQNVNLPARGSVHIIADSLLNGGLGVGTVDGNLLGSVVATAMHYGKTPSNGTKFVFGINAKQAAGKFLKGSYNTFLAQTCSAFFSNATNQPQKVTVYMRRYEGTTVVSGEVVTVPANGVYDYNACSKDAADNYGVLTAQPEKAGTIVATIVRKGNNDSYRFSTPTTPIL